MKFRHRSAMKIASWCSTQCLRTLCGTMPYEYRSIGLNCEPHSPDLTRRVIYVFWHEYLVLPSYLYARPDVHALVSPHSDGRFLADVLERLGFRTVHGSSNHGGSEAMRHLLKISKQSHIAITPDGPRGPRRKVKEGAIYLAAKTGMPIVPFAFAYSKSRRVRSWDELAIPKMFSRGYGLTAPPIHIPRSAAAEDLEIYRQHVEETLHAVSAIARRWAGTGLYDTYDYDCLVRTQPQADALMLASR